MLYVYAWKYEYDTICIKWYSCNPGRLNNSTGGSASQENTLHHYESLAEYQPEGRTRSPDAHQNGLLQQQSYNGVVQPAEYEVFQPSPIVTSGNFPLLLNNEPGPYEVVVAQTGQVLKEGDNDGAYETVRYQENSKPQHQDGGRSNSIDGHLYYTLEPRNHVKVA